MKAFILILLIFLIPFGAGAQTEPDKKNEFGIVLLSFKSNYDQFYSSGHYLSFLNGITYKRIFGQSALRLGIDFSYQEDKRTGDFIETSEYKKGKFITGYQLYLMKRKIKPYVGMDLEFMYSKFQNEFSGGLWSSYHKDDLIYKGFGISPLIGLNYRLMRSLSISIEANLELLSIFKNGIRIENSPQDVDARIEKSIDDNELVTIMNPLNIISINYSF